MAIPNSFQILQAVIEATPDAIFVKDLEGRYVLVNEAFSRFIGKSQAEIVGRINRLSKPIMTLMVLSGVLLLGIAGLWLWQGCKSF